jgi:hypothetical protein
MKFDIVGLNFNYGSHRFSNNTILKALAANSQQDDGTAFIWWVEKIFINSEYEETATKLESTDWFGVMHVPLLTPNWAQYSQNNLSKMYFSDRWKRALKRCKGIIVFSEHMKTQLESIYPELNVFSLKHPVGRNEVSFDVDAFRSEPSMLLVGTWLRNFESFVDVRTSFSKKVLFTKYSEGYLRDVNSKYSSNILSKIREMECIGFLNDDAYDRLFSSSLIYLDLYETSANNAICECLSYDVPFIAKRHPAIIEYVGEDYPLLFDNVEEFSHITVDDVIAGHQYLKQNRKFKENLSLDNFIRGVELVCKKIL